MAFGKVVRAKTHSPWQTPRRPGASTAVYTSITSGGSRGFKPVRTIAVTSGKGGVGKTNVAVNLALALTGLGREVLLLDADLGLGSVAPLLGLEVRRDISHVIRGEASLAEVIVRGPRGLQIVPSASGVQGIANQGIANQDMADMGPAGLAGLIRAFSDLPRSPDTLIVDTAAGIHESVVSFTRAAHEVIVVVCDEPASISGAFALIQLLSGKYGVARFHLLANMVDSAAEGEALFRKILHLAAHDLDVTLAYAGPVPRDEYLRRAVRKRHAVIEAYPRSRAAAAFQSLARKADNWPLPDAARGHLEFFVERLFGDHSKLRRIAL